MIKAADVGILRIRKNICWFACSWDARAKPFRSRGYGKTKNTAKEAVWNDEHGKRRKPKAGGILA